MKHAELIWQIAVVRYDDDGRQWLEFSDPRACGRCSRGAGCGAALFSRLFSRPDTRLPMPDKQTIAGNRLVRVGLNPGWLMRAAAATYLLPVIAFVTGAVFADLVWPESDPAALFSATSFALLTVLLPRYALKSISRPRLQLVDLHQDLESAAPSGHLPEQVA